MLEQPYYLAQQLGLIIGVTTSAAIVRTLFVNDLRRSLRGVSQIESVRITAEALVPELMVESSFACALF